jgi:integrase
MLDDLQLSLDLLMPATSDTTPAPTIVVEPEPTPPDTLAAVMDRLQANTTLSPTRRRDLLSAVRRVAEALERPPETISADQASLRHLISVATPNLADLGPKTRANLFANLRAALVQAGSRPLGRPSGLLSPAWAALTGPGLSKSLAIGLSRLLRFLSHAGIDPEAVTSEIFDAFRDHLDRTTLGRDPYPAYRAAVRAWNTAVATIPGWPPVRFEPPRETAPVVKMPASLVEDIEAYLLWAGNDDPFAETAKAKPLAPRTVALRRRQISGAFGVLVKTGRPPETVGGLIELVEPASLKTILRAYRDPVDRGLTVYGRNLAGVLMNIAEEWVGADHAAAYKTIRKALRVRDEGLTPKNSELIARLRDPETRSRLLTLPRTLADEATRLPEGSPRAAVQMQLAVAIEILLKAPMRSINLIGLRLDRHILRPRGRDGVVHIRLDATETKAKRAQEFEIAGESRALFDRYLAAFRPTLADIDCPFLFPGADRRTAKAQSTLAKQIVDAIARYVGVHMTAHQFRHVCAALLLERDPANAHVVKTLLGHASVTTVLRYYARLDAVQAGRVHDRILEEIRAETKPPRRGRR